MINRCPTHCDALQTEYTYDDVGHVTHTKTSTSGSSYLTTSGYDKGGRLISQTDGNNLQTNYTYDLLDRQITAGAQGVSGTSQFTYNTLGWQLQIQDADGFTTARIFDKAGRVTSETSAGYTSAQTYQDMGSAQAGLLKYMANLPASVRYEQNDSHITKTGTWSDYSKTEASGGSYGRSSSSGASATISFTGVRLDWFAMVGSTPGIVDVYLDNVLETSVNLSATTAQYQVRSWSTGIVPAGNHTVRLVRDSQSPAGTYIVLDAVDVWASTDTLATYAYGYFGRQSADTETAGVTPVKNGSATYDTLGRTIDQTDSTRNLHHLFTYPQNQPGETTDASWVGSAGTDRVTTTVHVAADGLETSRVSNIASSPQVPDLTRSIDPVNDRDYAKRVTKATLQTGTARYIYAQYAYDSAGRIIRQWGPSLGDGSGYLEAARTGQTPTYTYDATSGLKTQDNLQLQTVGSGLNTVGPISSTYSYTTNSRLATAATNGNPSETYQFDAAGNLTTAGAATLAYNGNCLSTVTAGGATTYYFFDSAKKWRTVQAPTNNQSDLNRTTFAYMGTGRLQTYTKYSGGTASVTASNTYDAQGQRTQLVVTQGGLATTTNFAYRGLSLLSLSASQTGNNATSWKITYLYDENGKPYAGIYRSPGTSTTPVVFGMVTTDRGDVVELLDAAGDPFAAYRYDAWGNPQGAGTDGTGIWTKTTTLITDAQVARDIAKRQVLRYAGYCWDALDSTDTTVGLYYLSARSYDPKTHQFLSKDLSRNDGEQSAYQYCTGNPVTRVDPTGLMVAEYQSVSQAQLKQDQEALFYYELYASFRAKYAKSIIHQSQHKAKVVYIGWKESTSALGNSKGGATHAQISPAESDGAYGNYSASLGVYDAKGSHSVSLDISWAYGSEGVHVTSNNEPRAGKGGEGGWVKGTLSGFPYFDGPDDGRGFIGRVMGKWENKGFGCSESTYWMTAAVGIRGDTVYVYRPVISHELYIDPGHPEAGEVQVNEPPREAPVWETP